MGNEGSLKSKTFTGAIWSALERFAAQGISFVVMIIMARILTPADYGLVGMVLIFIHVAQSLVDSGFSQALIRKQDRDETDNSTVFYFNIVIGVALYVILWFLAPVIADFYNEPRLRDLTRVICLGIIFNSLVVVQRALLTVSIDFKTQAKASLFAAFSGGVAGISMAYTGWGVWSIVAYHVANLALNCGLLWLYSSWRPKWLFSWVSFRQLFSFGSRLAVSGLLHNLYINGFNMVIGKVYKAADLGFYTRGQQFVSFFSSNISGILQRVTYPVLCRFQDDDEKLGEAFLKMVRISSYVVFSLMMGMVGVAKPMIGMLLGEKWLYSAVLMQILCCGYMWFTLYSLNLNILLVKGRSDLYLRLEIIKKLCFIAVLCAVVPFGLDMMCWGVVVNSLLEVIINSYYTGKMINVSIWKQLKVVLPSLAYAVSTGLVAWLVSVFIPGGYTVKFIAGVASGILWFILVSVVTGSTEWVVLVSLVKRKKHTIS